MKERKYTVLYLWESIYPILFGVAVIALEFIFYFRLLNGSTLDSSEVITDGATEVAASSLIDLFPVPIFLAGIVFVILYMLVRFVYINDSGVRYTDIKNEYFIPWRDVEYVKITLNGNNIVGRGSYIVIATSPYTLQSTDFRASRDGFIVLRYRRSAVAMIRQHYYGEIIRATSK